MVATRGGKAKPANQFIAPLGYGGVLDPLGPTQESGKPSTMVLKPSGKGSTPSIGDAGKYELDKARSAARKQLAQGARLGAGWTQGQKDQQRNPTEKAPLPKGTTRVNVSPLSAVHVHGGK